jgi:hypothetical protein
VTDLIFFAGPVIVTDAMHRIDWGGRDVRIVPIVGSGSTYFSQLAEQLRDSNGRILPNLVRKYAPGVAVDKIVLAAFSAGHGLLNKITDNDADRADVDAMILSDATFSGFSDPPKPGYVKFGVDAAHGRKLMVSTTADTSDGTYLTGRASFALVWNEVQRRTGSRPAQVSPKAGVLMPSGGWWRLGSAMYWGVYSHGTTSDIGHGDHDTLLAAAVWQTYLAPWLAGGLPWGWILGGAAVVAGAAYLLL